MLAASIAFGAVALAAYELRWGLVGVWLAILALIGVRLALLGWRFAGRRWAVTGTGRG